MKIRTSDYMFVRLASLAGDFLRWLGDLESNRLRHTVREIPVESPIFIAGLARSGTTILLEELAKLPGMGTHRYRDFPCVLAPVLWNKFLDRFATNGEPEERPHQDRIQITAHSPEAFEEPIWQHFFPRLHKPGVLDRLTGSERNPDFEKFFDDHLRKILLIRRARRYLSKGNYNLGRIEYLAKIYPSARFVVPVRHPVTHVQSLVRQHDLFCRYAEQDGRVARYLAAAGHYEFGPQRVPIRFSNDAEWRIRRGWSIDDGHLGYAAQWAEVYGFVQQLRAAPVDLSRRILIVQYEDFCASPRVVMQRLLEHCQIDSGMLANWRCDHISAPETAAGPPAEIAAQIWDETAAVANHFGYRPPNGALATEPTKLCRAA